MSDKYNGLNSSAEDFFSQFEIIAAINSWSDDVKTLVLATYLCGPALSYYNLTKSSSTKYEDIKKAICLEFPSPIDHASLFYKSRQDYNEPLMDYVYRVESLAGKAKISDQKIIIKQCLTGMSSFFKRNFGTQLYKDFATLKQTCMEYSMLFMATHTELSLPVKITSTRCGEPSSYTNSMGDGYPSENIGQRSAQASPQELYSTPQNRSSSWPPRSPSSPRTTNFGSNRPRNDARSSRPQYTQNRYNLRSGSRDNVGNIQGNDPNFQRRQ